MPRFSRSSMKCSSACFPCRGRRNSFASTGPAAPPPPPPASAATCTTTSRIPCTRICGIRTGSLTPWRQPTAPMSAFHGATLPRTKTLKSSPATTFSFLVSSLLSPQDDTAKNANPVLVLSYSYWKARFGATPDIAGQTVLVNGHPFTVLGVAPRNFDSAIGGYRPGLFLPISMVEVAIPWMVPRDDLNNCQSLDRNSSVEFFK